ncbi:MAG: hypothetical protein KAR38_14120 [Calditrichia bacterium]|nr:hypothetical protein [Calditrichia bacterium]
MVFKDKKQLLFTGMITLSIAIILGRMEIDFLLKDFVEGILYGMSLTLNLFYLITIRREKNAVN